MTFIEYFWIVPVLIAGVAFNRLLAANRKPKMWRDKPWTR